MRTDLTLVEAVETLTGLLAEPKLERVSLLDASKRVLADDLRSLVDHPSSDDSALDGYAVRLEDTRGATPENPVRLAVVGEVAAGASAFTKRLETGQAVKVFTGATVPDGTTGIAAVENTSRDGAFVMLNRPATPDVRRRGQDLERGRAYLGRGQILRGPQIALAAAMGHGNLPVLGRPRIAILSTGDEIVEPGQDLPDGGVYNSNYGLAALVREMGGEPIMLPHVPDNLDSIRSSLDSALDAHLIASVGGVSMGERDFVRTLLETEGTVHFWRLKLKPGGPPLCGSWRGTPFFGLPGNPVSSMVVFMMVIKAAFYARYGVLEKPYETVLARALVAFKSYGAKLGLQRATLAQDGPEFTVKPFSNQSSQVLRSMVESNALALIPPDSSINAGDVLEVVRL
jgi:molybdopterin molybdotransferase